MKITVVGGGNIGTQFAVHSAEKGHEVTMFTSNPGLFASHLSVTDKDGNVIHEGDIAGATNDPHEAFSDADMIMITMPPTMMIPLAEIIYEHTDENTIIGFVPGNGGFELAFRKCIERGNIFFGIDRVPGIARLTERGRTVCCSGYKGVLYVAAIQPAYTDMVSGIIEDIYDIPCVRMPGFLALTLTPSNPILHTTRLYTIFKDYRPGVTYDELPLFYEDWNDESSALLLLCDDEIMDICAALPDFGLGYVVSEREFYHADNVRDMTRVISTEESLLGLTTPAVFAEDEAVKARGLDGMRSRRRQRSDSLEKHARKRAGWRAKAQARHDEYIQNTGGPDRGKRREYFRALLRNRGSAADASRQLLPDLHSRYFTADFPYGLAVIRQIGEIAGVDMPNIDMLLEWYDGIAIINDKLMISDYGITDKQSLRDFYMQ